MNFIFFFTESFLKYGILIKLICHFRDFREIKGFLCFQIIPNFKNKKFAENFFQEFSYFLKITNFNKIPIILGQ